METEALVRSLRVKLNRQALATFGPSPCENLAAIGGCHAGAETVSTSTANAAGLVGALHLSNSRIQRAEPSKAHLG